MQQFTDKGIKFVCKYYEFLYGIISLEDCFIFV